MHKPRPRSFFAFKMAVLRPPRHFESGEGPGDEVCAFKTSIWRESSRDIA